MALDTKRAVLHTAKLLMNGDPHELRALDRTSRTNIMSGIFAVAGDLATAAMDLDGDLDVYISLNPVGLEPSELQRVGKDEAVGDKDVTRIMWLGVDVDHDPRQKAATEIAEFLGDMGWPEPVVGSSGTGSWLLYRIDQENTHENALMRRGVLMTLKSLWSEVDTSVFNAARIVRLFGTTNMKNGKRSKIVSEPDELEVVSHTRLKTFAGIPQAAETAEDTNSLETILAALAEHGITPTGERQGERCTIFPLSDCLFYPNDTHKTASFLMLFPDGGLQFRCQGGRCQDDERNVRDLLDELNIDADYADDDFRLIKMTRVKRQDLKKALGGRIIRDYSNLVVGDEDVGKGLFECLCVSQITRGGFDPGVGPERVLVLSTEDAVESVLKPRLVAAGADEDYIVTLPNDDALPQIPRDLDRLARAIKQMRVKWMWLDPLNTFFEKGIDYNKSQDVNRVMKRLNRVGQDTGCTIIGNLHTNREKTMSIRQKIAHQIEFLRVARSGMFISEHPDLDDNERVLLHVKSNYSVKQPPLKLVINSADDGIGVMRFAEDAAIDVDLDEVLLKEADPVAAAKEARANRTKIEECAVLIEQTWEELGRPRKALSDHFYEGVDEDEFTKMTWSRARRKLGVTVTTENDRRTGRIRNRWDFTELRARHRKGVA